MLRYTQWMQDIIFFHTEIQLLMMLTFNKKVLENCCILNIFWQVVFVKPHSGILVKLFVEVNPYTIFVHMS